MNEFNFMRRVIVFLTLITFVCGCGDVTKRDKGKSGAQQQTGTAEISFREYEHDFGKVTEGEKVAYIFSFENKGPGTLVINSASTSCGCTVTKFERNPIPAGNKGSLEVVFDTGGRNGLQTKTITVQSNSTEKVVILKITAEVIARNK